MRKAPGACFLAKVPAGGPGRRLPTGFGRPNRRWGRFLGLARIRRWDRIGESNPEPGQGSARVIQKIVVDLTTTFSEGASTRGAVYLGLGGREFRLDMAQHDDFEEGDDVTYVFGEESNVLFPERNDPRLGLPLSLEDVSRHPVYVRLEPQKKKDDWEMATVRVRVSARDGKVEFAALQGGSDRLWLGSQSGTILHLRRI